MQDGDQKSLQNWKIIHTSTAGSVFDNQHVMSGKRRKWTHQTAVVPTAGPSARRDAATGC